MVIVDEKWQFETERLLIRPLRAEDAEDVFLIRSNPRVAEYLLARDETIDDTKKWLDSCLTRANCWNFSVELLTTSVATDTTDESDLHMKRRKGRVIGNIGAIRAPEVGYGFHPDFWGKGIATEAFQAFMQTFWELFEGTYDYARAQVDPENGSSIRLLERGGFQFYELRKNDFESKILGMRDTVEYRMQRPKK